MFNKKINLPSLIGQAVVYDKALTGYALASMADMTTTAICLTTLTNAKEANPLMESIYNIHPMLVFAMLGVDITLMSTTYYFIRRKIKHTQASQKAFIYGKWFNTFIRWIPPINNIGLLIFGFSFIQKLMGM